MELEKPQSREICEFFNYVFVERLTRVKSAWIEEPRIFETIRIPVIEPFPDEVHTLSLLTTRQFNVYRRGG